MMRKFNTTGKCDSNRHYMVDIRMRLEGIKELIEEGAYFSINRARQYGKTTMLHALKGYLQPEYIVASLDFQFLSQASFMNEYTFVSSFSEQLVWNLDGTSGLDETIVNKIKECAESRVCDLGHLFKYLSLLCKTAEKPVVLLIDEVDSASNNQVFLDFLAQLRGYYIHRDERPMFQAVILAGVYDIKNLKRKIRPELEHKINSPWNIAADFDIDMSFGISDISGMLLEYEKDHHTGMDVTAMGRLIYSYTSGYPFLVSRLCMLIDSKIAGEWDKDGLMEAVNLILLEDNALFDSLIRQLHEYPELKDMLYSILFQGITVNFNKDNYLIHLAAMFGFVKNENRKMIISNRIFETRLYNFFMSEESVQNEIFRAGDKDKNMFVSNGILNMDLVMERFAVQFNNVYHGENDKFIEDNGRKFFLLFLKPIINGVGNYYVEARTRDNRRTDIIVNYHGIEYIIEVKIWHGEEYNKRGEVQLADYLDIYAAKKGWLLSFNFNKNKVPGVKEVRCGDKILLEVVV